MNLAMQSPTLEKIPIPPLSKTGWPWTEESPLLPHTMPDGRAWPKISIVTPSFNQGRFIEETIRSVLLQNYPNLEYIIIDGGSTDKTVEIIKRYEPWISYWVSEKDRGQAYALNKGFRKATGLLIGWQNSDDYYGLSTFSACAVALMESPEFDIYHGRTWLVDSDGKVINEVPSSEFNLMDRAESFPLIDLLNQSIFFRRTVLGKQQFVDESYRCGMDTELITRLVLAGCKTKYVSGITGFYRIYSDAKTFTEGSTSAAEACRLCAMTLTRSDLSQDLRKQIIKGFRKMLVALFRSGDACQFRAYVKKYWRTSEVDELDFDLVARFGISLLGNKMLKWFLRLVA